MAIDISRLCASENVLRSLSVKVCSAVFLMFLASAGVVAQEVQDEAPAGPNGGYNGDVVSELREVQEKYPLLSERLGLVGIQGFRIPLLCIGGIDPACHRSVQQNCLDSGPGRPDYQHCLDLANKVCCRPATVTQ